MKSSVKVKLRRKPNKDGQYAVVLRITCNSCSTDRGISITVSKQEWNSGSSKVSKGYNMALKNETIRKKKAEVESIIYNLSISEDDYGLKDILSVYDAKRPTTSQKDLFTDYLDNYIVSNPDDLGFNTLKYYKTTLKRWKQLFPKLRINEIREHHIIKYREYLVKKYNTGVNTTYNALKVVRKMCHMLVRKGELKASPFANVTLKQNRGTRQYLDETELELLRGLKYPPGSRKELTLDVFLLSLYTGLRYSDLAKLRFSNCTESDGNSIISLVMSKTSEQLVIGLNTLAKSIVEKYRIKRPNMEYVFPMLDMMVKNTDQRIKVLTGSANAWMNTVLKDIIADTGIDKHISIHCARHSHAVISLDKGADIYTVSKMLGHTSVKTTEVYLKMTKKKRTAFVDLWDS